jgi:hypothetical protein
MGINIGHEIAVLKDTTVGQLRQKYREVFGEVTRVGNKDFLFKRITWRIQSLAEGDLSERARQPAAEIARDADIRMTTPRPPAVSPGAEHRTVTCPAPPVTDERVPPPGTCLARVYRGRTHHVTILPDGFEYDGQVYRTLSAVAKVITGSHWNGYLFFGLAVPKCEQGGADA